MGKGGRTQRGNNWLYFQEAVHCLDQNSNNKGYSSLLYTHLIAEA